MNYWIIHSFVLQISEQWMMNEQWMISEWSVNDEWMNEWSMNYEWWRMMIAWSVNEQTDWRTELMNAWVNEHWMSEWLVNDHQTTTILNLEAVNAWMIYLIIQLPADPRCLSTFSRVFRSCVKTGTNARRSEVASLILTATCCGY